MKIIRRVRIKLRSEDYCDPFWDKLIPTNDYHHIDWESVTENVEGKVSEVTHTCIKNALLDGINESH